MATTHVIAPELAEYQELARDIIDGSKHNWTYSFTTNPYFTDGLEWTYWDSSGIRRSETTFHFLHETIGPLAVRDSAGEFVDGYHSRLTALGHVLRSEIELSHAEDLLVAMESSNG